MRKKKTLQGLILLNIIILTFTLRAQENENVANVLDPSPVVSARAAGMGGAISPIADGTDAGYFNPAGIGGYEPKEASGTWVRVLHFPLAGGAANKPAREFYRDFVREDVSNNPTKGETIVKANEGKRVYARASSHLALVYDQLLLMQSYDAQLAALKRPIEGSEDSNIEAKYRTVFASGAGFRASTPGKSFRLGVFSSFRSQDEFNSQFAFDQLTDRKQRKELLKNNSLRYEGFGTNVGMLIRFYPTARPAFSIVARDVGDTPYKLVSKSENNENEAEDYLVKQDLTAGLSVSPRLASWAYLHLVVEGHNLDNEDIPQKNKPRGGLELSLGGFGRRAFFGLRGGYSIAGASYGASLNLGILNFAYAVESVDIGKGEEVISEQREAATIAINIAEP